MAPLISYSLNLALTAFFKLGRRRAPFLAALACPPRQFLIRFHNLDGYDANNNETCSQWCNQVSTDLLLQVFVSIFYVDNIPLKNSNSWTFEDPRGTYYAMY